MAESITLIRGKRTDWRYKSKNNRVLLKPRFYSGVAHNLPNILQDLKKTATLLQHILKFSYLRRRG
ncbi:hypothetical protein C8R34_101143 [Nitrosomonas sp. Nm84]|nr:hypothetical protein C8R34_101143 [Nitrosomonas sp. Nm84]